MSLVGRIEDLGLGEILQIVALSGKSGVLHVRSRGRTGDIFFFNGKVVRAFSDTHRLNLGEMLIRKNYATQELIEKALTVQRANGLSEKLGQILIRDFGITKAQIEECVTELIETLVFSLFYWTEGEFQFELNTDIRDVDISVDLLQYDLAQNMGLNPQFLAMEGTRILDERKRGGLAEPEEVPAPAAAPEAPKPVPQPTAAPAPVATKRVDTTLLLVDDFVLFRSTAKNILLEKTYTVVTAESIVEAKSVLAELLRKEGRIIVIVALIMPRTDNSGILGGLEFIQMLPPDPRITVIATCDYSIPAAEEPLKKYNAILLKKPKRRELNKETARTELEFFIRTLESTIGEGAVTKAPEQAPVITAWDTEIKEEFHMESSNGVSTTPGLTLLKSMITELKEAGSGNEIILMILRLASEIMPRGVVFAIKGTKVNGLGQFGFEGFMKEPHKVVRSLALPITGKFKEVIENGFPYKGVPPDDELMAGLFQKFGGTVPTEIFVSPIFSGTKPMVLFYGDNLPEKGNIQDTDALEIFFNQAGQAMERVILEKK